VIRLLGRQTSGNVQKAIFCLEELGLPYTREDYGRQFGNTLTDAYRKLNPNAKVPTMIDGDLVIWESHTILRYLAAVHGPTLTGATPAERTMVERWMDWLLGALNTPYVAVFKDAKKAPAERAPDFAAQAADLVAQLKILDGHIAERDWFALDRFTIADIALGSIVKRGLEFPIERPPYPELTRWQAAIDARPAFAGATGTRPSALSPAA
jgi:glutathione S-transferase